MEFSPQGGNGMARTSSDAVRRVCSCQSRVLIIRRGRRIFSTFSAVVSLPMSAKIPPRRGPGGAADSRYLILRRIACGGKRGGLRESAV